MRRAIAVVATLIAVFFLYEWYTSRPIPFEAAAWRAAERTQSDDDARQRMADWMIDKSTLIGKSRSEIEAALGPVADTSKFRDYDMVYWLGRERGTFSIDSEWLVLRLDSSGRATSAELVRD